MVLLKKPMTRPTTGDAEACDDSRTKGRDVESLAEPISVPKLCRKIYGKETLTVDDKEVLKERVYRETIEFETRENEQVKDNVECENDKSERLGTRNVEHVSSKDVMRDKNNIEVLRYFDDSPKITIGQAPKPPKHEHFVSHAKFKMAFS